jgi:ABC-type multidrug transport system ATPase subunit
VLTSASLRAVPGEVRALLGRNGVGKTTLLKIAAGWIAPDSGTVHCDGSAYPEASLATLAKHGVFYWPDRYLLSNSFTVRRQLTMFERQFDGERVEVAAERARVTDLLDRAPHALSGGERRRAELAAVLVRRPRCLLADEPFRGIDPKDAEKLAEEFRLLARAGAAVVATGHEVPVLLSGADHVTWCTSGTTHELGAPATALLNDAFRREYLGPRADTWSMPPDKPIPTTYLESRSTSP